MLYDLFSFLLLYTFVYLLTHPQNRTQRYMSLIHIPHTFIIYPSYVPHTHTFIIYPSYVPHPSITHSSYVAHTCLIWLLICPSYIPSMSLIWSLICPSYIPNMSLVWSLLCRICIPHVMLICHSHPDRTRMRARRSMSRPKCRPPCLWSRWCASRMPSRTGMGMGMRWWDGVTWRWIGEDEVNWWGWGEMGMRWWDGDEVMRWGWGEMGTRWDGVRWSWCNGDNVRWRWGKMRVIWDGHDIHSLDATFCT